MKIQGSGRCVWNIPFYTSVPPVHDSRHHPSHLVNALLSPDSSIQPTIASLALCVCLSLTLLCVVEMDAVQLSPEEQEDLIEKSEVFRIRGRDKRGRKILRIVGKFFSGTDLILFYERLVSSAMIS